MPADSNAYAPAGFMKRYSFVSLAREALRRHRGWPGAWRFPSLKPRYRVAVVGGGGHGLATAYYLAKLHGIRDVVVLEKGWIGGGNTGRNTTIIRSNYQLDDNARFYEHALRLWEGLSRDLNYNVMFSQRGVLNLAHADSQMDAFARRGNRMRLNGIDAELLDRKAVAKYVPLLDTSDNARFPVLGGLLQGRGGVARHDAVAWGFARAADALGVDIVQECEVVGFRIDGGCVTGIETTRGSIEVERVGLAVAGHSGRVAELAGLALPIESHVLQAFVTEPVKPLLDHVVTSGAIHCYISQTDKGEVLLGGDLDGYNSYAQRGNLPVIEHVAQAAVAMYPAVSRLRVMRSWGGVMDMSMDGSPIIGKTPIENLFIDGGWCYGGFKATPGSGWVFAHTIAHGAPHELNAGFGLDRFATGRTLDENGAGPTPNAH